MEEIQSYSDNYRSSSSSASSPINKASSGTFFYLRKPGAQRKPISFEDSPEWDDVEIDPHIEGEDSIHVATNTASPSLSKVNSGSLPSPSAPEASSSVVERKIAGASIVWKDLCVTIKEKRKYSDKVIKCSNGYAFPGTLTVIMGPARSGKSTLLRAIAVLEHGISYSTHIEVKGLKKINSIFEKKKKHISTLSSRHIPKGEAKMMQRSNLAGLCRLRAPARLYGEVFVNGVKSLMPYGSYGYVDRKDELIESLTVSEFLYYSALLQLPGSLSQKKALVEDAISAMSLGDYADKLIGGHCFMKHLPCGERRRVSIARELVTRPHVLFIDEPLYHLDSVSALLLMVTLKKLASTGCTLIFTMYQSSTEVFGLFDRICLLSNGNTLFFGETLSCLQHFSNAGFPCPIMQSPSDHFLRAINTDFDRIIAMCKHLQDDNGDFSSVNMDTAVAIRTLEATYRSSADSATVESMILRLTEKEGPHLKSKGRPSDMMRITVLMWRSLLTMSRERKYFWIRLLLYILLTLSIGTVFSNSGHSLSSVMVRVSAIFVFVSFMSLLSIVGLPAHIKEIKIFTHEESNQHSGAMVFLLGHFLASIPFIFLISISATLVFYFLGGLRNEFNLLVYFVLNIFMCLLANEGLVMVVAYILFEAFSCLLALVFLHVLMMLVAGYFRIRNDLPEPIWKYPLSYVAFHTYSVQGLLENEYIGTSFAVGEVRAISGLQAVGGSYEISASRNAKWKNLLVLFLMAIGYRILLFLLLRFRIRASIINRTSNFWILIFKKNAR